MKKVMQRAATSLLLAALIIAGLSFFVFRLAKNGGDWSSYFSRRAPVGEITDRQGVKLYLSDGNEYSFADDLQTRLSCYQLIGDLNGAVGTAALRNFRSELSNYSFIKGAPVASTLRLTIDTKLQKAAHAALGGRDGSVMLLNYKTGEILCMVSNPTQDPMNLSATPAEGTYLNKCINAVYTPGSVFKLLTLGAAIENIPGITEKTFSCSGMSVVGGAELNCSGTHGNQTLKDALKNSCNVAFSEITLQLGSSKLDEYAKKAGFTVGTKISGIDTKAGSLGNIEPDSIGLAWAGIGQHEDQITPFSMLKYVSAIANDGAAVTAKLKTDENSKAKPEEILKPQTAVLIKEMMQYNVEAAYGTWRFPDIGICAKTGTAETGTGSSHSWFTGFAGSEQYPIAFVVLAENAGAGAGAAAEIASYVLRALVE
ncbi:MAG: hypothetical protein GX684_03860 [Ruminococcaceae bacterium]|nr:hypothetical protein [Oscillospiraceae bacterium]